MFHQMTKAEFIKMKRKVKPETFYENDEIQIDDKYLIQIRYGEYDTPRLCSRVMDLRKYKYIDLVFWPNYISNWI